MNRFFLLFFFLFSALSATDKVLSFAEQYPEILWLADENVRKTEEGWAAGVSHSERLFGRKFVEFDRTIMTLNCLHLILDGSDDAYETFVSYQPQGEKLLRNSFISLHLEGQALLKSGWEGLSEQEMLQAMETSLVLGDMGKSEKARELYRPLGIAAPDHDDFHGEALNKAPELCPSFTKLPKAAKTLLQKTANLAHYGHIFHLEGGPSMYTLLKESGLACQDPTALAFDLFVHTCDVAGAQGHVNQTSSLSYKEKTHLAEKAMEKSVWILSDPTKGEADAYNDYLSFLAHLLGLDPNERVERAVIRLGAMLRLYAKAEGTILKNAIADLEPSDKEMIIKQFDLQPGEELLRTPTYMPVVLLNLSKSLDLTEAVTIGLPFIARVLEQHKQNIADGLADPNIPLNFNKMGSVAKNSPYDLMGDFFIDEEGNVLLGCPRYIE